MNPLLNPQGLPHFSLIQPEHVQPALAQVLADNRQAIARLLEQGRPYTWDSFIRPLEDLGDRLEQTWGPATHLHAVADSDALRDAYNACLPLLSEYRAEFSHNQGLYQAYREIAGSPEFSSLAPGQQRTINNELRDFHLHGIDLPPAQQARYKDLQAALSKATTKFGENLLDATHAWKKHLSDDRLLAGLPDSARGLARQQAEQENLDGWLLTLDGPCYQAVMNYADSRDLRREMYQAFVTRASETGNAQFDNGPVMAKILQLRHELANLLGFKTYAEYSLASKMAETPQQVLDFLTDLAKRAKPMAQRELEEVQAIAQREDGLENLEHWDIPYYSEKLRRHLYDLSQEDLRPYFPLPRVLEGLFRIVHRLYGISIEPREDIETWHPDVKFFDIYDESGQLRAQFYLDLYARQKKRGGAWMGDCITRKRRADSSVQLPVAYMNCNFMPPVGDQPALLTHTEVVTLFHEFGHGLHHMLTQVDFLSVSGINGVPWDAVELPSQFMENWCWARESLDLLARHWQTHAPLPAAMFDKLLAAKNFQAGLFLLRQLEFAVFDMRLHHEYQPDSATPAWIQGLLDEVRNQVAVIIPPGFNRFQHSFSHIFAGGYAAGYYSYKWAEVLSADAFSRFEETSIFDAQSGRAFLHHILEQGGSREPLELFKAFRGRGPDISALLRHNGLA